MDIIVYAHEQKLLSWIDSKDPARKGSRKINAFISKGDPVGKLAPEAAERWRNSGPVDSAEGLTSHSIHKAAVSMALASGVSKENIRRFIKWREPEMTWVYADTNYKVPERWRSCFAWMLDNPAQNA